MPDTGIAIGTDLVAIETLTPAVVFAPGGVDTLIERVEREARAAAAELDISTPKGRRAIASLARKVASTKTGLDDMGKQLTDEFRKRAEAIHAERRTIVARMDALRDEVRKPLDEYEAREAARIEAHEAALAVMARLPVFDGVPDVAAVDARIEQLGEVYDRDWQEFVARADRSERNVREILATCREAAVAAAEREAEIERRREELAEQQRREQARLQAEREAAIAAQAAEQARQAAEAKAERERQAEAARVAQERQAEAERVQRERMAAEQAAEAERARIEAEHRRQVEAAEAERARAEREVREAKEAAAAEAARLEQERQAAERRAQEAEARRERETAEAKRREEEAEARRVAEAERARVAAEQAKMAAIERETHARAEAAAEERRRQEREAAQAKAEEERRAANRTHRAKVNNAVLGGLTLCGLTEMQGKSVIEAIARGQVPHVAISY